MIPLFLDDIIFEHCTWINMLMCDVERSTNNRRMQYSMYTWCLSASHNIVLTLIHTSYNHHQHCGEYAFVKALTTRRVLLGRHIHLSRAFVCVCICTPRWMTTRTTFVSIIHLNNAIEQWWTQGGSDCLVELITDPSHSPLSTMVHSSNVRRQFNWIYKKHDWSSLSVHASSIRFTPHYGGMRRSMCKPAPLLVTLQYICIYPIHFGSLLRQYFILLLWMCTPVAPVHNMDC